MFRIQYPSSSSSSLNMTIGTRASIKSGAVGVRCANSQLCRCLRSHFFFFLFCFLFAKLSASLLRYLRWCMNLVSIDSFSHHWCQAIVLPCNWSNCFDSSWQPFVSLSTSETQTHEQMIDFSDKMKWKFPHEMDLIRLACGMEKVICIRITQLNERKYG